MTLDFDNEEQYRKFVKDVAYEATQFTFQFNEDLTEDVASELVNNINLLPKLAEAVLNCLLAQCPKNKFCQGEPK